jgi:hypothetical protein
VFGSHISIARKRKFSVLWSDSRLYKKKPTIIVSSFVVKLLVGNQAMNRRLSTWKRRRYVCCSYGKTVINPLPG